MTVFAPKIFGYVGIEGQQTKLFTTGIFGIVKLLSSMAAAFFIVDLLGRKFAVMCGLSIQAVAAFYLAMYLRFHYSDQAATETASSKAMADAAIFFIFLSGFAWAIGVNSVQYLSQTEMVRRLRLCAVCMSPLTQAARSTVQPRGAITGRGRHLRRPLSLPVWLLALGQPNHQLGRSIRTVCLLLCHESCFPLGESGSGCWFVLPVC